MKDLEHNSDADIYSSDERELWKLFYSEDEDEDKVDRLKLIEQRVREINNSPEERCLTLYQIQKSIYVSMPKDYTDQHSFDTFKADFRRHISTIINRLLNTDMGIEFFRNRDSYNFTIVHKEVFTYFMNHYKTNDAKAFLQERYGDVNLTYLNKLVFYTKCLVVGYCDDKVDLATLQEQ